MAATRTRIGSFGASGSAARRGARRRVPVVIAVAAAALLALAAGCTGGTSDGTTTSLTPSPTTTTAPSPSTSPTGDSAVVPAYFVLDTRTGLRLARELRDVTGDPVTAAVEAMIAGPSDPDYATTWNPATRVLGVTRDGATIVVDLSADARTANVGSEGAALMIQQLVYTASGAAGEDVPVQLLIEGAPAGELWGAVSWDAPVTREDPLSVRLLVQIDTPTEGADVTSPVTVAGDAAAFEANVPWRVLDANGTEVQAGFTMTTEGQTFAPYSFTVDLPAGTYTVVITEDDPSGGAGGTPMTDSRTITVS